MTESGSSRPRTNWLRASRIKHWVHFLFLPLAGYVQTAGPAVNAASLARGVLIAFAVLSFGFLLNQVADRHMDGSVQKNPLANEGAAGGFQGMLLALAATALAASLLGPRAVTFATVLALLSGVLYSVGPRLKRYPILGTLINVTNFTPLLWVGLSPEDSHTGMGPLTACFMLLLLQNQLLHEAADCEDDRRGGLLTTFLLVGPALTAVAAALLGSLLVAVALYSPHLPVLAVPLAVVFAIATPLIIALRGSDAAFMARMRIAHRIVCVPSGAAVFWLSRLG